MLEQKIELLNKRIEDYDLRKKNINEKNNFPPYDENKPLLVLTLLKN